MLWSGFTILIISNEEMEDLMKIVKSLEDLLINGVSETNKNEPKEKNGRFIGMLLGSLSASLLGNLLKDKGTIRAAKEIIRAGENF